MYSSRLLLILSSIALFGCGKTQQAPEKQWFKGNLHTHSYWSDGDEFPEVILDWYKSRGYQFMAFTEHNTLAEGEKWKTISSDSIYQNAFERYLEKYGADWVNFRKDSLDRTQVKLKTYEEYRARFEEKGQFLIIQSEEITDRFGGKPLHLNATNVKEHIAPQGGNSIVEVLQNNIDEVIRQRDRLGIPMIVHINHPNFGYAISLEEMIALKNEKYFEVYNGHHLVHNSGDSLHISTERMWDLINIAHVQRGMPLMYGLATDDSHNYHNKGREWSNAGRGWITVRADSLYPKALINAMEVGDFYASTGVELSEVTFENNRLSVAVNHEAGVTYEITFIGYKNGATEPEVLLTTTGTEADFEMTEEVFFVRCKVTSSKLHSNPIEDLLYETAWTQPVMKTSDQ